ncbi:MAG: NAD-dependent epimerase/dehydratase family protein [Winogradskyella sp.]|uniref:NAD-dependent epimerase/dehydratase family protein n=1 Tax=Winogradskyella sp. TaxID=1883156 RepID=UPI000F40FE6D|nr:NAD-dependent epimerase/dehydratase family protein [Winogradskyella sp.]RNC87085.1 MAG: NAD-dependent epimerase/dehydratase family protein [Winogradskyella sp.]
MKIFITGGSGFVGQSIIPILIKNGFEIFALARSVESAEKVKSLGATPVRDDLTSLSKSTENALKECDYVIHSAAHMDLTYDKALFYKINVEATKDLLIKSKTNGIKKFIYISAAPVVPGSPIINLAEKDAGKGLPKALYPKTKAIAEQLVLKANDATFMTLSLRPPAIWGPDNHHYDDLLDNVKNGKWRWIGGGHQILSTIHVKNLASAIIAAFKSEKGGQAYFITDGDRRSVRETFTAILNAEGLDAGDKELPRSVALFFAHVFGGLWKILGLKSRPPVMPLMIRLMGTEFSVSDQKARTELGYENVIDFQQGIKELKS